MPELATNQWWAEHIADLRTIIDNAAQVDWDTKTLEECLDMILAQRTETGEPRDG